jgi:hypothetical protein
MAVPISGDYAQLSSVAQKAWEDAQAQVQAQKTRLASQYGFNPDGTIGSNPYGQYQQVQHNYQAQLTALNDAKAKLQRDSGTNSTRLDQDYQEMLQSMNEDKQMQQAQSSASAAASAAALQATLAGIGQQRQFDQEDAGIGQSRIGEDLTSQLARIARQRGYAQEDAATSTANDTADNTTALKRIADARARDQQLVGLTAQFDANGNPVGDPSITPNNPMGQYQRLLTQEGYAFQDAEDAATARGLGTKGLANRDVSRMEGQAKGDRYDMKQGLIDALTSLAQSQQDQQASFSRGSDNTARNLARALAGYGDQESDANRQASRGKEDITRGLAHDMASLQSQEQGAQAQAAAAQQAAALQAQAAEMQYAKQLREGTMSYKRSHEDLGTALSDALDQFNTGAGDLGWQKGLDEYNLSQGLLDQYGQLDQEALGATNQYSNSLVGGLLDDILNRIANGDFSSAGNTAGYTPTYPVKAQPLVTMPMPVVKPPTLTAPKTTTTAKKPIPNAYVTGQKKTG